MTILSKTTDEIIALCLDAPDHTYEIPVEEGTVVFTGRRLLIHAILWHPVRVRGMPLRKTYVCEGMFTKSEHLRIINAIYMDITRDHPEAIDQALQDALESTNRLHNITVTKLGAYYRSMSLIDIAQTMNAFAIKETLHKDMGNLRTASIYAIEDWFKSQSSVMLKTLKDPTHRSVNKLFMDVALGTISEQQLAQVIFGIGTRTDVNDMTILHPIYASYVLGMTTIQEYAVDSLFGKKSRIYNTTEMSRAQYKNRIEQLFSSVIRRIHPRDCGTELTVPYDLHEGNAYNCLGKIIRDGDRLVVLDRENVRSYIGSMVYLRSPLTCRHTNGYCETCGGLLTRNMLRNTVPGIAATVEIMGPISQLILSNKHLSKVISMRYILPHPMDRYFKVHVNDIYLQENTRGDDLVIGAPRSCFARLQDLKHVIDDHAINDQYFSQISHMALSDLQGTGITPLTPMESKDTPSVPYLSLEILRYLKDHPEQIYDHGDMIWVSLKGFPKEHPVFRYVVSSDSMPQFARSINALIATGIASYTDIPSALRDVSAMMYRRVSPNLLWIETLLKASLITSGYDCRVPMVTDIHDVMFGTHNTLFQNRTIGSLLAYQNIPLYLKKPQTYIIPKPYGIFDTYFAFNSPSEKVA